MVELRMTSRVLASPFQMSRKAPHTPKRQLISKIITNFPLLNTRFQKSTYFVEFNGETISYRCHLIFIPKTNRCSVILFLALNGLPYTQSWRRYHIHTKTHITSSCSSSTPTPYPPPNYPSYLLPFPPVNPLITTVTKLDGNLFEMRANSTFIACLCTKLPPQPT